MSFPGSNAVSFADITLIIQITGFIILFSGAFAAKRKSFLIHFKMARIAVFLGVVAFMWMGYSLISYYQSLISVSFVGLLVVSHVIIGLSALFTGLFFAFDRLIKKTRTPMRIVFLLWSVALFSGLMIYLIFYTT